MDQDTARTLARDAARLARKVGHQAAHHGCQLTNRDDPSVPELVLEAARLQMGADAVLPVVAWWPEWRIGYTMRHQVRPTS